MATQKNMVIVIGMMRNLKLFDYKAGTRGYVVVNDAKVRIDFRKKNAKGDTWTGFDAAVANLKALEGKRVMVRGYLDDGSFVSGEEVITGNRIVGEQFKEAPDNVGADRILYRVNAMRIGNTLYYAKHVGSGCLEFHAGVCQLDMLEVGKLVSVTIAKTMEMDDFGFEKWTNTVVSVDEAVEDKWGMFTEEDVAAYPAKRVEYEKKLFADARAYANYKKTK